MEEKNMRELNMDEMDKVSGGMTTEEENIKIRKKLEKELMHDPDRPVPVEIKLK